MNINKLYIKIIILSFIFFGLNNNSQAQKSDSNRIDFKNSESSSSEDYINFYQKYISDLRGNSCPMFPSCSNYTLDIIKAKGVIAGLIEGSDRLLRCGHEHEIYPITFQEKGFKLIDLPGGIQNRDLIFETEKPYYTFNSFYNDSSLNLIATLINEGLYSEALIEIAKKKSLNKDISLELVSFEMLCLNAMKRYEKVILNYDQLSPDGKKYISIIKQLYKSHYKLGNYNEIIKLKPILESNNSEDFRVKQLNNLTFVSYLRIDSFDEAKKYILDKGLNYKEKELIETTVSQLQNIKKKSPTFSKISSAIIPGMGYIYNGHVMTGISALIINSLLGYATYSSFKSGNNGIGILTGILNLGFYFGNIQGSGKSAIRENQYNKEVIIKMFENQTIINN
jgi:putative component of membrane protein insertase Oxa1/YidC/SpoIIIJ protein YidD